MGGDDVIWWRCIVDLRENPDVEGGNSSHTNMTHPVTLFSTPGSVYRRYHRAASDDDVDILDASLPSTPVAAEAGPSTFFHTSFHGESAAMQSENDEVKLEHLFEEEGMFVPEDTPLRSISEKRDEDDRQCRICFSGMEEEETLGRLISPCLCSGSMRVSNPCVSSPASCTYLFFLHFLPHFRKADAGSMFMVCFLCGTVLMDSQVHRCVERDWDEFGTSSMRLAFD